MFFSLCVFRHERLQVLEGQGPEHMYLHVEVLGEMMDLLVPMGRVPFLEHLQEIHRNVR